MPLDEFASYVRKTLDLFAEARLSLANALSVEQVRDIVRKLEASSEFESLYKATGPQTGAELTPSSRWQIPNFFKRSGFYLKASRDDGADVPKLHQQYEMAFSKPNLDRRYLVPLQDVGFEDAAISFDNFSIVNFTRVQLDELVGNEVNRYFYPDAVLDSAVAADYWFIDVLERASPNEKETNLWDLFFDTSIPPRFTEFSTTVESILKRVALWDWEESWLDSQQPRTKKPGESVVDYAAESGWLKFRVPFVLTLNNDLRHLPTHQPTIVPMSTEPVLDDEGEEVGERVRYSTYINTSDFRTFIKRTDGLISEAQSVGDRWRFIEVALGFFVKAFFSREREELLWHITAIEALLAEGGDKGVMATLNKRLPEILGKTKNERTDVRKRFYELYDLRSKLVHGDASHLTKTVYQGHLRDGRKFARQTLLWFLEYLHQAKAVAEASDTPDYPNREEMLLALDLEAASRKRISVLLAKLPTDFPRFDQESQGDDRRIERLE